MSKYWSELSTTLLIGFRTNVDDNADLSKKASSIRLGKGGIKSL